MKCALSVTLIRAETFPMKKVPLFPILVTKKPTKTTRKNSMSWSPAPVTKSQINPSGFYSPVILSSL